MTIRRFSLRTLVVILTLICVYLGYRAHRMRAQRDALRKLGEPGVDVVWTFWDGKTNQSPRFFSETQDVILSKVGKHNLSPLSAFSRLQSLGMRYSGCTLEQVRTLPKLTSVREAYFSSCPLGDDGIGVIVERLPNLRSLNALRTGISDTSIAHLRTLHLLERLDVSRNPDFTGRKSQQSLCLPRLTHLNLDDTSANDETVESLVSSSLTHLDLVSTQVTPNAISNIMKLKTLKSLTIWNSGLDQGHESMVQAAIPGCSVNFGPFEDWWWAEEKEVPEGAFGAAGE